MFDRVKGSLYKLLHSALGIKMNPPWVPTVLPSYSEPIVPYSQRMAAMATIKKGDGITLLKKWRVTRTRAYKRRSTSWHEYISATVINPDNKRYHVAIERHRGDPISIHDTDIEPAPVRLLSTMNSSCSSISDLFSTGSAEEYILSM